MDLTWNELFDLSKWPWTEELNDEKWNWTRKLIDKQSRETLRNNSYWVDHRTTEKNSFRLGQSYCVGVQCDFYWCSAHWSCTD